MAFGQELEVADVVVAATLVPLIGGGSFLSLAIGFFVLAIVAGVAGFRGVAGISMEAARLLVLAFIVLAVIAFLL